MSDIQPPIADQIPVPGGNVNEPASGTQGDKIDVERLRQALPPIPGTPSPGQGPGSGPVAPLPPRGAGPVGASPDSAVPGIPGPILDPTNRPGSPLDSPVSGVPGGGVPEMTPQQDRMRIISALAQSDDPEVREWAELVQQMLLAT